MTGVAEQYKPNISRHYVGDNAIDSEEKMMAAFLERSVDIYASIIEDNLLGDTEFKNGEKYKDKELKLEESDPKFQFGSTEKEYMKNSLETLITDLSDQYKITQAKKLLLKNYNGLTKDQQKDTREYAKDQVDMNKIDILSDKLRENVAPYVDSMHNELEEKILDKSTELTNSQNTNLEMNLRNANTTVCRNNGFREVANSLREEKSSAWKKAGDFLQKMGISGIAKFCHNKHEQNQSKSKQALMAKIVAPVKVQISAKNKERVDTKRANAQQAIKEAPKRKGGWEI